MRDTARQGSDVAMNLGKLVAFEGSLEAHLRTNSVVHCLPHWHYLPIKFLENPPSILTSLRWHLTWSTSEVIVGLFTDRCSILRLFFFLFFIWLRSYLIKRINLTTLAILEPLLFCFHIFCPLFSYLLPSFCLILCSNGPIKLRALI